MILDVPNLFFEVFIYDNTEDIQALILNND